VKEYWLVDVRHDPVSFDILRRNSDAFVITRKMGGWLRSIVFRKQFRLVQTADRRGNPKFLLETK
jgi:hypothetical protein